MKTRFFVALAQLMAAGLWAASPVTNELALPERILAGLEPVLRQAAEQSPRMVSRALDLEIAENNRIQARANLLPSVGGYYRQYEASDDRADQTQRLSASKTYYDFSISQPLFHWGERRNNARIGEIQENMAEGNYREAYRHLIQELRQKYLGLIVQKQRVARARLFLNYAKQEAVVGEERLAKKVISEMETVPIRLRSELAQIDFDRAEFDYATAKDSFARLAGISSINDGQVPDVIPETDYPAGAFSQLLADFLSQRELPTNAAANLRRQMQIEDLNYRNQQTRLRPKFGLVVGLNQDQQSYTLNTAQKYQVASLYGGVTVSWTIFDGFASQAATRNALARRRQVEADYSETVHRLGQQAQSQAKQVEFAARTMAISDRAFRSAEGTLRGKQEEFRRGMVSETDVALAEIHLMDARIAAFNSRSDYLLRTCDFLGTLVEDPSLRNAPAKQ